MQTTQPRARWQSTPFAPGFGSIIVADGSQDVLSLDIDDVMSHFRSDGLVLFRGFALGPHGFTAFTERFTERFTRHSNRRRTVLSDDGTLMTVTPGTNLIRAHDEMAYRPLRPDALWFHCVRPAREGGETFVVDGAHVVQEMTPATRTLLLAKKVKHRLRNVSVESWQSLVGAGDVEETFRLLDSFPGLTYERNADGGLDMEFLTSAIKTSKYGNALALNTSILDVGGVFEDDTPIPKEVLWELAARTMEASYVIPWQRDDIAMIDNTRLLHGRKPFTDPERSLRIRMGNLEM
jgi:alpha-ketoglutarate-dependent taurine dioxygenase